MVREEKERKTRRHKARGQAAAARPSGGAPAVRRQQCSAPPPLVLSLALAFLLGGRSQPALEQLGSICSPLLVSLQWGWEFVRQCVGVGMSKGAAARAPAGVQEGTCKMSSPAVVGGQLHGGAAVLQVRVELQGGEGRVDTRAGRQLTVAGNRRPNWAEQLKRCASAAMSAAVSATVPLLLTWFLRNSSMLSIGGMPSSVMP